MTTPLVKLTARQKRVVDYMNEHGGISSKEAMEHLGNARLSGTILSLRRKGLEINTLHIDTTNRYGEPTWYGKYVFAKS